MPVTKRSKPTSTSRDTDNVTSRVTLIHLIRNTVLGSAKRHKRSLSQEICRRLCLSFGPTKGEAMWKAYLRKEERNKKVLEFVMSERGSTRSKRLAS